MTDGRRGHPFVVSGYRVAETTDATAFLEWARPVLAAQPLTTTVLATVAATRAVQDAPAEPTDGSTERAHWWVVRDAAGTAVGAAGFAGARQLLVSAMPAPAAAALAVAVDLPERRRLHGPADTVTAYADALPTVRIVPIRVEIVRVLGDLVPPRVAGHARPETDDDLPLLVEWMAAAIREMGTGGPHERPDQVRDMVTQRRTRTGYRFWEVDGRPRSVASWARRGELARIGPVYTPPAERRRGYGSAVTAALAAELRADGATVLLHADESNATSNHIYAELGFAAVHRLVVADLVPGPDDIPDSPADPTTNDPPHGSPAL